MTDKSYDSYVWNERNDLIGSGATSNVYKARCKKTGEYVAVKVYDEKSISNPQLKRELDLLQKINHKNVVRLIQDKSSENLKSHVVLMEYCNGSSLANIIEQPINFYGLPESEFLLVLKHITDGMIELNRLEIAHRDIKPGNILLEILKNGEHVYKLSDFGAAKEFSGDQVLTSIVGTEEYVFPEIYESAFFAVTKSNFKPIIDLWSIGVTLYQIATGQLPFQPIGGRKNKDTMIKLTKEKETGVISAVQKVDGTIKFKKELPKTTLLSNELQNLLVPMLAGLIENNYEKMWNFKKFFDYSAKITNLVYVNFVDLRYYDVYEISLEPSSKLADLKTAVKKSTFVDTNSQNLMYHNLLLNSLIDKEQNIGTYPFLMNDANPLLLFDLQQPIDRNYKPESLKQLPLVTLKEPETLNEAINWCKEISARFYDMQRKFTKYSMISELLKESALSLKSYVGDLKAKQDIHLNNLSSFNQNLQTKSAYFERIYDRLKKVTPNRAQAHQKNINDLKKLKDEINEYEAQMNFFRNQFKVITTDSFNLIMKDQSLPKLKVYFARICEECQMLYEEFLSEKKNSKLMPNKLSPFSEFRCNKIKNILIPKAFDLYNEEFLNNTKLFFDKYVKWFNDLQSFFNIINNLEKRLKDCENKLENSKKKIDEDIENKIQIILDYMTDSSTSVYPAELNDNNGLSTIISSSNINSASLINDNQSSQLCSIANNTDLNDELQEEKVLSAQDANQDDKNSTLNNLTELRNDAEIFYQELSKTNELLRAYLNTIKSTTES